MPVLDYHLGELAVALDRSHPDHILPSLRGVSVGIVDVGCGIGQLFIACEREIPRGVLRIGIDVDSEALGLAQRRWPHAACFVRASGISLPLQAGSVDLYVARVSLPYLDIPEAIREASRVLTPGGSLWITLHPLGMVWSDVRTAIQQRRPTDVAVQAIRFFTGLAFNAFGWPSRPWITSDLWISSYRVRRILRRAGFRDIRISLRGNHFLAEATKP